VPPWFIRLSGLLNFYFFKNIITTKGNGSNDFLNLLLIIISAAGTYRNDVFFCIDVGVGADGTKPNESGVKIQIFIPLFLSANPKKEEDRQTNEIKKRDG
jgi:hypothetical protein